jgi:hypothetical protein
MKFKPFSAKPIQMAHGCVNTDCNPHTSASRIRTIWGYLPTTNRPPRAFHRKFMETLWYLPHLGHGFIPATLAGATKASVRVIVYRLRPLFSRGK